MYVIRTKVPLSLNKEFNLPQRTFSSCAGHQDWSSLQSVYTWKRRSNYINYESQMETANLYNICSLNVKQQVHLNTELDLFERLQTCTKRYQLVLKQVLRAAQYSPDNFHGNPQTMCLSLCNVVNAFLPGHSEVTLVWQQTHKYQWAAIKFCKFSQHDWKAYPITPHGNVKWITFMGTGENQGGLGEREYKNILQRKNHPLKFYRIAYMYMYALWTIFWQKNTVNLYSLDSLPIK